MTSIDEGVEQERILSTHTDVLNAQKQWLKTETELATSTPIDATAAALESSAAPPRKGRRRLLGLRRVVLGSADDGEAENTV